MSVLHRGIALAAAMASLVSIIGPARADYPDRPVKLVVPFPPGGALDVVGRIVVARMGPALGQSIVIDNRGGAGGALGAETVARAEPDGYTLLVGSFGTHAANPALSPVRYDPIKDFVPIGGLASTPFTVDLALSFPATNLSEMVQRLKAEPKKYSYGSYGPGSASHLATEFFRGLVGSEFVHVPYRGAAPALNDLITGRIDFMLNTISSSKPFILDNRIRTVAIASKTRSQILPQIPSAPEAGMPDLLVSTWFGIFAPAGTPEPIVKKLNAALQVALRDPDTIKRLEDAGTDPMPGTPDEFRAFVAEEIVRWKDIIGKNAIKVN
jgi:tripartite-type tricarboxylate transporter receptor subunit TctC